MRWLFREKENPDLFKLSFGRSAGHGGDLAAVGYPGYAYGSKLEQLESLILERFIGDADQTAMEDAAAAAMVKSLNDRWSYYIPASE